MFGNHFFQKLKGLLVKVGLFLSFGCMRLNYHSLGGKMLGSFKQALKRFLKLNQRSINALFKQSLIPYIDLSWACDPSLRAFDML
ncbi:hypothetical protein JP0125_09390 [Helicobacter pylori]|nr:hypothetical protein JP0125_09390 [Helicobacter pylori]